VLNLKQEIKQEVIAIADLLALERIIGNRNIRFAFKKKGRMHVSIS